MSQPAAALIETPAAKALTTVDTTDGNFKLNGTAGHHDTAVDVEPTSATAVATSGVAGGTEAVKPEAAAGSAAGSSVALTPAGAQDDSEAQWGEGDAKTECATLIPIYLTVFIDTMGLSLIIPVLPFFARSMGINALQFGVLMTAYSATQVVGALGMGYASDRFGRKPVIVCSILGSCAGFVATAFASSFTGLLLARALGGVMGGSIPVAQAFIADATSAETRTKYLGLCGATIGIAFTVGPGIGALLTIDAIGASPRTIFLLAAGFSACACAFAALRIKEVARSSPQDPAREARGTAAVEDAAGCLGVPSPQLLILLARFCSNYSFTCMQSTYAFLLVDRWGYGSPELGGVLLGAGLLIGGIQGGAGAKIPQQKLHRAASVGSVLLGGGLCLMAIPGIRFGLHLVFFALHIVGFAFMNTCLPALASLNGGRNDQGKIQGLGQSVEAASRVASPLASGALYTWSKKQGAGAFGRAGWMPFLVAMAVMALALAATLCMKAPHPSASDGHVGSKAGLEEAACGAMNSAAKTSKDASVFARQGAAPIEMEGVSVDDEDGEGAFMGNARP